VRKGTAPPTKLRMDAAISMSGASMANVRPRDSTPLEKARDSMDCLGRMIALTLMLLATSASANFHTFRIQQLYSNAEGTIQYIVFHESQQFNGEHVWGGHVLVSTGTDGREIAFTFPVDLPAAETSDSYVLVATKSFAALGLIAPDYIVPDGFLPVAGGQLNFADVDALEFRSLPTDGTQALLRDGTIGPNVARNFRGASASVKPTIVIAPTTLAVEYYYADWNYYFMTAFPAEIAVLDGGAFGGVWKRTGESFSVWQESTPTSSPTCRFFSTSFAPKSSHFYTPFSAECATVKSSPDWQFESVAFHMQLAAANGLCGADTVSLYRLYNNGMGGAPNHRYTTSPDIFNLMIAAGWSFEGDGNTRVFACVPK